MEDKIVKLLEEIRDLHKKNNERCEASFDLQKDAIKNQKQAVKKMSSFVLLIVLAYVIFLALHFFAK